MLVRSFSSKEMSGLRPILKDRFFRSLNLDHFGHGVDSGPLSRFSV